MEQNKVLSQCLSLIYAIYVNAWKIFHCYHVHRRMSYKMCYVLCSVFHGLYCMTLLPVKRLYRRWTSERKEERLDDTPKMLHAAKFEPEMRKRFREGIIIFKLIIFGTKNQTFKRKISFILYRIYLYKINATHDIFSRFRFEHTLWIKKIRRGAF